MKRFKTIRLPVLKLYQVYVILIALSAFFHSANAQDSEWKLTWADEFNYSGLPDSTKWGYEKGYIRNKEKQFYTSRHENARVEDGMLVIEARKEPFQGYDFTSASLITKDKKDFLYGRIEVKAKIPTGVGMWPAIWLLGKNMDSVGWPTSGEIDIMENVGFDPDTIHANIHTTAYNHVKKTNKGSKIFVKEPHKDFHIYAVEWQKDKIDFFVDDKKYFTFKNERKGNDVWPFDKPHYLILNIAVGGAWGGQKGVDESIFPQKMLVDYVRVYEKKSPLKKR